jgi:hypothetical protein
MSLCWFAAPNPTRTPISVVADWGCTCRAVAVPRQTQHAPQSARTPTGVAHVGLLPCRAKHNTHPDPHGRRHGVVHVGQLMCRAKPSKHPNQRGRRLGLHMSGCCRAAPKPTRTTVRVDADWGCTCRAVAVPLPCRAKPNTHPSQRGRRHGLHMSGCCRAAPKPTRTPINVDADWGCTCRAVVAPRQTQHAPQSAWTPTGVAHVGLLPCRAKPNTHPDQRGRRQVLHMSGC